MLNIKSLELKNPPDPFALFADPLLISKHDENFQTKGNAGNSEFRAIWSKPDFTIVGISEAVSLGFEDLDAIKNLPSNAMLIGGSRFMPEKWKTPDDSPKKNSTPDWKAFGDSRLVVPEYLVCYMPGKTTLLIAGLEENSHPQKTSLKLKTSPEWRVRINNPMGIKTPDTENDDITVSKISEAIKQAKARTLEKVILAICLETSLPLPFEDLLLRLKVKFENCAIFAIGIETGQIFFGASPELLLQLDNQRVFASALAGSAPISSQPKIDRQYMRRLKSRKERYEHKIVVTHIIQELIAAGVELAPDTLQTIMDPMILELPGIRHLYTPISGCLSNPDTHILEILKFLAPTPAVAGSPTPAALNFISQTETFDRGWYGGSVGWCRPDGQGEFYTALRSGLLSPSNELSLFAGAGILADSKPERELAEMKLKLEAIKNLFSESSAK